jgi:sulfite reductase beta subunit-like hemoprotein
MTTKFPAFEAALASNNHDALRLLYEVAMHQRDRAEDTVRCLLTAKPKTVTLGDEIRETRPVAMRQRGSTSQPEPIPEIEF